MVIKLKTIPFVVFIVVLFLIAILCLLYPHKVQEIAIKSVSQGYLTKNSPIESFVKSSKYLSIVRVVGGGAAIMFCFLVWAFFRNTP